MGVLYINMLIFITPLLLVLLLLLRVDIKFRISVFDVEFTDIDIGFEDLR